jgi:RNA recognition motif-containing protein
MKSISKLLKSKGRQLDFNPRLVKILFFFSNYSQKIFEIHPGRRNPIGEESESSQIENKNIETTLFKSIDNSRNNIAFMNYVPTAWTEKEIKEHFDTKDEKISKITIVKNRLGNPTGKALIEFKSETLCDEFIQKWNENFIETKEFTQKIVVKAFSLKKHSERTVVKNKHKTVYLKNIDFEATVDDIYKMASDFGEIINMDLPLRKGKNMGYGFVNFRNSDDAESFQQFADEKLFMGRKLR